MIFIIFGTPPDYSVLSKVHQKVGKFATKYLKLAKIVQNFMFSLCQKVHWLEKSTPPPMVAMVANMRYAFLLALLVDESKESIKKFNF